MSVLSLATSALPPPLPFPTGEQVWRCTACHKLLGVVRGQSITIAYHGRSTTVTAPAHIEQRCKCGTLNIWRS